MELAAPCLSGSSETMIVRSPILASLRFDKHLEGQTNREGVHGLLPPVHVHLPQASGWLLFKPQRQRNSVGMEWNFTKAPVAR
jgi:hypothetical protein